MSFGFALGDFLAVINLADRLRKDWLDAPEEYKAICVSTRGISNILRDVSDLVDRADLTESQARSLQDAMSGCTDVLQSLNSIVTKYSTLSSRPDARRDFVRRIWKRFRTDPQDIRNVRDRLTATLASLNATYSAIHRTLTEQIQQDTQLLIKDRSDRSKLEIVNWLAPSTFAEYQHNNLAQRCLDTSEWFAEDPNFMHWRDCSATTLFCPGLPGAGKTVLAAAVIDYLQEQCQENCDTAIIYHYFDIKRPDENNLCHCLASLARQLLQHRDVVSPAVADLYRKYQTRGTRPTIQELRTLVDSLVSQFQRVYIIIDAVDEADVQQNFRADLLDEIIKVQTAQRNVNLMATSRQRSDISAYFHFCKHMPIRALEDDLHIYLDSRMSELMSGACLNVKLQGEIKTQIVQVADGMFLLARLHFDSLRGETTPRAIRRTLEHLPTGSEAVSIAYEATRERINQQLRGRRDLAMQTLMWVSCGLATLTLRQLQHALAIEHDMEDIEDEYDLVGEMDLLSACAGLISIDADSKTVHLIHLTLYEYLEHVRNDWFPDAYTRMATQCVNYLSLGVFGQTDVVEHLNGRTTVGEILRHPDFCGYSFLEHSTKFWGFYAQRSSCQDLSGRLCSELLAKPLQWRNFCRLLGCPHSADMRAYTWWHEDVTPLHVSAYFGFQNFAKELLNSGHDLQLKDSHGMTALMWAVMHGQKNMVELILDQSSDAVQLESDKRGTTPLIFAAANGHTSIADFLLKQPNVDPNLLSKYDGTALNRAVSNGHIDVVYLLLSHPRIKPRTRSEHTWSPLQSAAYHGHIDILILLLNQVIWEPDDWGLSGSSPLHLAADAGHKDIVELLIKRPEIDINALNDKGSTPLAEAAGHGRTDVIKLLLAQSDILPNSRDDSGTTPLMRAIDGSVWSKFKAILPIMKHPNVDLNLLDIHGQSALIYAIRSSTFGGDLGKVVVRSLLAVPEVVVNFKDRYGYTPLHHSVLQYNHDAVRMLLQRDDCDIEAEALDGHTPLTLILERQRAREISSRTYRCTALRDPETPYVVVIASSQEPNFALEFYQKDFVCSSLRVQDVRMMLSLRWKVDIRQIQLTYKSIELNIGWSSLSDFDWEEGDLINVEVTPVARSFSFTAEEFAKLDAFCFDECWQALRAASCCHDGSVVVDGGNVGGSTAEACGKISPNHGMNGQAETNFELDTSDEEDDDVREFLGINEPRKKREPPSSAALLELRSALFEQYEKAMTKGSSLG